LLGAGGMGEVYRARDTKLGRDVALKFLSESLASDPIRLARFEREAQTLAALNHPNIAQVYGFHDGVLVLEFLEGETLSARVATGPLSMRKAIDYGTQIARGLAAAHDRGIIHRDLKPDNVFILRDGHVKIIDFGLARETVSSDPGVTGSMTIARFKTEPGMVMGTVGYMAPEQVRGEALDARADLFAFGAVLYEMVTGQRAFRRETTAETMTAILREDPQEPTLLRQDVSPALDRIIRHCLEKNPIERFQTARDVAFALESLSGSSSGASQATAMASATVTRGSWRERSMWLSLVALLAAAVGWLSVGRKPQQAVAPSPPAYRAVLPLPEGVSLSPTTVPPLLLALSQDARRVAFVGTRDGRTISLWVLSTSTGEARELPGTERANGPIWLADNKSVAFGIPGTMKRIDVDGGVPIAIGQNVIVGSSNASGDLLGTTGPPDWMIRLVSTRDGKTTDLIKPTTEGERLDVPSFLPDGNHFLFYSWKFDVPSFHLSSLDAPQTSSQLSLPGGTNIQYANGAVVFATTDRIVAQPFDLQRMQPTGESVTIAEHVGFAQNAGAAFALSENGTLVYAPQESGGKSRLTWMDRDGRVVSTVSDEADYSNLELSRDGRRLAVSVTDPSKNTRDIYVVDLERGVRQRLTFDPSDERSAVWSPDGKQIIYSSKKLDLYRRPSDFSGNEEPLLTDRAGKDPREVSSDGQRLLFRRTGDATGNDIWIMPLTGDRKAVPLLNSPFDENYASFAPDARSIVYVSNESGRAEVYVMSLQPGGGKVQVSTTGGTFPRWRHDGKEIVYVAPDETLMSVPVSGSGPSFRAGTAATLFKINIQPGAGTPFDLTADGKRFIVNAKLPSRIPPSLNLVVNWPSLLQKN
jgi:serine/threonine protein kinase/Tol biopolymer transport system component